jgi:hypothetical protein
MEKEYSGQYPSINCECHFQEPYGFVPEADCPEHDTKQFKQFLIHAIEQEREKWDKDHVILNNAILEIHEEEKIEAIEQAFRETSLSKSKHNDWCESKENKKRPCDCGVEQYNIAILETEYMQTKYLQELKKNI